MQRAKDSKKNLKKVKIVELTHDHLTYDKGNIVRQSRVFTINDIRSVRCTYLKK